jgi:hypothetical protein
MKKESERDIENNQEITKEGKREKTGRTILNKLKKKHEIE